MRCKQARRDIALSIGRDLSESAEQKLHRHLAVCPDCRDHRRQVQAGLSALQECDEELDQRSVWPSVERRLADLPEPASRESSFSLAPAFAVVAACLIMYVSMDSSWVLRPSAPVDAMPTSVQPLRVTPVIAPAGGQRDFLEELRHLQNAERHDEDGMRGFGRRHILEYR